MSVSQLNNMIEGEKMVYFIVVSHHEVVCLIVIGAATADYFMWWMNGFTRWWPTNILYYAYWVYIMWLNFKIILPNPKEKAAAIREKISNLEAELAMAMLKED